MHCAWPGDYHSLSLTRIQFHPPKVTPLINLHEVTAHWLCYFNFKAWGWHNSYQSLVIGITDQLILQNGKKSFEVYRRNNNEPKTLPCGTPDTTSTSLLLQPSIITCCDRSDRNCANIDNTEPPIPTEQSLYRIPWWLTISIKGCAEINLHDPSLLPSLQCKSNNIGLLKSNNIVG